MATVGDCEARSGDYDDQKTTMSYELSFLHSECERPADQSGGDSGAFPFDRNAFGDV